jgi:hypothetical protein
MNTIDSLQFVFCLITVVWLIIAAAFPVVYLTTWGPPHMSLPAVCLALNILLALGLAALETISI